MFFFLYLIIALKKKHALFFHPSITNDFDSVVSVKESSLAEVAACYFDFIISDGVSGDVVKQDRTLTCIDNMQHINRN